VWNYYESAVLEFPEKVWPRLGTPITNLMTHFFFNFEAKKFPKFWFCVLVCIKVGCGFSRELGFWDSCFSITKKEIDTEKKKSEEWSFENNFDEVCMHTQIERKEQRKKHKYTKTQT